MIESKQSILHFSVTSVSLWLFFSAPSTVCAQSLDERLDHNRYLRGLTELQLSEVLEHYISTHPSVDPVQTALFSIAAARLALRDPSAHPAQRESALDGILRTRKQLIEDYPDDARCFQWQADQAEDLYFELLPVEGSGLAVLFGVPSESQQTRADRVAQQMYDLADHAWRGIDRAIVTMEATEGFSDNLALQLKRRRLTENERDRRIPFLRGIGACLVAALLRDHSNEQSMLWQLAADLLEPLAEQLERNPAVHARLYAGLALARLGEFDRAEQQFTSAADDSSARDIDVFFARMGGVINRKIQGGLMSGLRALDSIESKYTTSSDLFYRLLLADRRFLWLRADALQFSGIEKRDKLNKAYDAYVSLLHVDLDMPISMLRSVVASKLTEVADEHTPLATLPVIVTIARAERMARSRTTKMQAIELFESVLDREDVDETSHAIALFGLGRVLVDTRRYLDAAQRFLTLAVTHSTDTRAERAIELAASLSQRLLNADPSNRVARDVQHRALDVLIQRYPNLPSADTWRYVAGRLALNEKRYDEASILMRAVSRDAEEWLDARYMLPIISRHQADREDESTLQRELQLHVIEEIFASVKVLTAALDENMLAPRRADIRHYLAALYVEEAGIRYQLDQYEQAIRALDHIEYESDLDTDLIIKSFQIRMKISALSGKPGETYEAIRVFLETSPDRVTMVMPAILASLTADLSLFRQENQASDNKAESQREIMSIARQLLEWMDEHSDDDNDASRRLKSQIADALRLADQYQDALSLYELLLRDDPFSGTLVFGRAECLFEIGGERLADAIRLYKRIINGGSIGGETYWIAQLRILQILDRAKRNIHQIIPRINKLRLIDPDLGGEQLKRAFEALENKYS